MSQIRNIRSPQGQAETQTQVSRYRPSHNLPSLSLTRAVAPDQISDTDDLEQGSIAPHRHQAENFTMFGQSLVSSHLQSGRDIQFITIINPVEKQLLADKLQQYSAFDMYHDAARDQRCPGTCDWFFELEEYRKWEDEPGSILWVYGDAGVGKTTLISIIIDHLRKLSSKSPTVLYFYCDYATKTNTSDIFATLLGQALQQTSFEGPFPKTLEGYQARKFNPAEADIIACLKQIATTYTPTYIIIESLHECPDVSKRSSMKVLRDLSEVGSSVLISSRPVPDVELYLSTTFPHYSAIELKSHHRDLITYVDATIESISDLKRVVDESPSLKFQIKQAMTEGDSKTFLLVVLHMREILKQATPTGVRTALEALSTAVKSAYTTTMYMISDQEVEKRMVAYHALSFIALSKRPVTANELLHLLAMTKERKAMPVLDDLYDIEYVLSACKGMIRVSGKDRMVSFFHPSFQEFLEEYMKACDEALSDHQIGLRCLHYLALVGDSVHPPQLPQSMPFFAYASDNWGYHIKEANMDCVPDVASYLKQDQLLVALNYASYLEDDADNGMMHHCAIFGLEAVAKYLIGIAPSHCEKIRYEDAINKQSKAGNTPLHVSSEHGLGEKSSVDYLPSHNGVNINHQRELDGSTALPVAPNKDITKLLLSHVANPNINSNDGLTALSSAALGGYTDVIEILLSCDGVDVNHRGYKGYTLINIAAEKGHKNAVALFLSHGADPNIASYSGRTALWSAAWRGHADVIEILLPCDGVDVNHRDEDGFTPINVAAERGHKNAVTLLLLHGANPNITSYHGTTALSSAALGGYTDVIEILLPCDGVDVNPRGYKGYTPINIAAEKGHKNAVAFLLSHGADPNITSYSGRTALWSAARGGHVDVIKILLPCDGVDVNHRLNNGCTPIGAAAEKGHKNAVALLLSHGAHPNIESISGETPLWLAAWGGHEDVIKILLPCDGVDVNHRANNGFTPINIAAETGHKNAVALLLSHGADPNIASYSGRTALWSAACRGHADVIEILLPCDGVDVNHRANNGYTPVNVAARSGDKNAVALLLSHGADPNIASNRGQTVVCS